MRGCEYGEFAACGFSCLNPLVSIQLGRIKYIIIFNGADTVIALSVADAVEYVEVMISGCATLSTQFIRKRRDVYSIFIGYK